MTTRMQAFLLVGLFGAAVLLGIAWTWYWNAVAEPEYALIQGLHWKGMATLTVRVDDPALLAQMQIWRGSRERENHLEALRKQLLPPDRARHSENALRQITEQITLVYPDGRREVERLDINRTPFKEIWQKARDQN